MTGLPEFAEGMSIGAEIATRTELGDGDVVVVSQKVVSKAEGRVARLAEVEPSPRARELAARARQATGARPADPRRERARCSAPSAAC